MRLARRISLLLKPKLSLIFNNGGKIYYQDVSLMPNVNVHRLVVIGINFEIKAALLKYRSHNQTLLLNNNLSSLG